jgi:hypothetical protein
MTLTHDDIAAILLPLEVCFGVLPVAEKTEYALAIIKAGIDEARLRKAVAYLRENHNPRHDGHKIPYASEIIAACRMPVKVDPAKMASRQHCDVCEDQGWILKSGVWREDTESRGADSALICGHCELGAAILRRCQREEAEHLGKCPLIGTAQDKFENERDYEAGEAAWHRRKDLLAAAQNEQGGPPIDIKAKQGYTESMPDDDGKIPF